MIACDPLLPSLVTLLAMAILCAGAAWAYRRGGSALWPRLGVIAIVIVALLNPVRVEEAIQADPPVLALIVDGSASMARRDAGDGRTRHAAALAALEQVAAAAGARWRIQRWSLADGLAPGDGTQVAGGTDFDGLERLATSQPPAAVVLASDGCDRGTGRIDALLAAARVPVSCLAVGSALAAENAAVRLEAPGPSAFVGQDLTLSVVITATPGLGGRQTELRLGTTRQTVTLAAEVRIPWPVAAGERAGEQVWEAALAPLPEEAATTDNQATLALPIVDRRLKIVVIEGQPWFDTAAAVRSWRRDRQLLVTTYQRAGTRTLTATGVGEPPAPDVAVAIATADLLVIGLEAQRVLGPEALTQLDQRIRAGVGLLLLGGWRPGDDAMVTYDPVLWSDQAAPQPVLAVLTATGERLALAEREPLARLPGLPVAVAAGLRPLATVAIGDAQRPLLVIGRHGAGRTASLNADGVWRWHQADPVLSERLWRQIAKALAAGSTPPLAADRERYRVGASARIAVAGNDPAPVTVTAPDGTTAQSPVTDGVAVVDLAAPGRWRLAHAATALTLIAEADVRESTDDARRDERLARLAATTGGRALSVSEASGLGAALARRADLQVGASRRIPLVIAWWWWTMLAGCCLGWEWWVRRRRYGRV